MDQAINTDSGCHGSSLPGIGVPKGNAHKRRDQQCV